MKFVSIIFVGLTLLVSSCATSVKGPPAVVVTMDEYTTDWIENPVSAEVKYKNKIVSITGEIGDISYDSQGDPSIALTVSDTMFKTGRVTQNTVALFCFFKRSSKTKDLFVKLKTYQQITIMGKAQSAWNRIVLKKCAIVDTSDNVLLPVSTEKESDVILEITE